MDASQIVVAALSGISLALLVWVESRSRRNSATQEHTSMPLSKKNSAA
jgi:hypothetical protein